MITGLQLRAAMGVIGISKTALAKNAGVPINHMNRVLENNGVSDRTPKIFLSALREYVENNGVVLTCSDGSAGVEFAYSGPHIDDAPLSDDIIAAEIKEHTRRHHGIVYEKRRASNPSIAPWDDLPDAQKDMFGEKLVQEIRDAPEHIKEQLRRFTGVGSTTPKDCS